MAVGDDKVRIWMTDARHDLLIDWLNTLAQRHGLTVEQVTLEGGRDVVPDSMILNSKGTIVAT